MINNGFYIKNLTQLLVGGKHRADLRIEAYDANKQLIGKGSAKVEPDDMRFISADHVGSSDHIYILVFYDSPNYNPPPGIGIISGTHGQGGGGGFSIAIDGTGFGLSASGSATVTEGFSQPSLVARLEPKTLPHDPALKTYANPAIIGAVIIAAIEDETGEDKLIPIYVKDVVSGKVAGPPEWSKLPAPAQTWNFSYGNMITS